MTSATQWKRDTALWIEFGAMTAISIPFAQWSPVNDAIRSYFDDRRGDVYPAIVGLEGTVLGFVIAALTIVIGYANSPRFELLRSTRHWAEIFRAYIRAAKWTAVALLYGLAALLVDSDHSPNSPLCMMLLGSALLASIRLARVIYITEKVVKVVINSQPRKAGA